MKKIWNKEHVLNVVTVFVKENNRHMKRGCLAASFLVTIQKKEFPIFPLVLRSGLQFLFSHYLILPVLPH